MNKIEIYADGSATIPSKPGGYGYVICLDGVKIAEGNGYIEKASNNDAELEAAIQGLMAVFKKSIGMGDLRLNFEDKEIFLVSDSQIILNWANGTYRFKQVHKMDKYNMLIALMKKMNAKTRWVKGHSGDIHNTRCDVLANLGRLQVNEKPKKIKLAKVQQNKVTLDSLLKRIETLELLVNTLKNEKVDKKMEIG